MPYDSISELPENIKNVLPTGGQTVYKNSFNSAMSGGDSEETAIKKAWAAVKSAGYKRGEDGMWHKSQSAPTKGSLIVDTSNIRLLSEDINYDSEEPNAVMPAFRLSKFQHPLYGEIDFNETVLHQMLDNFNADLIGDIPVNQAHDRRSAAVGWIKDIEREYNNILAKVWFNEDGIDLIKKKKYKYASIEYTDNYMDPETGKQYGALLEGIALTNNPFVVRQKAVALLSYDIDVNELLSTENDSETRVIILSNNFKEEIMTDNVKPAEPTIAVAESHEPTNIITLSVDEFEKYKSLEAEREALKLQNAAIKREVHLSKVDTLLAKVSGRLENGKQMSPAVVEWARVVLTGKDFDGIALSNDTVQEYLMHSIENLLTEVIPCTIPVEGVSDELTLSNDRRDTEQVLNKEALGQFWS